MIRISDISSHIHRVRSRSSVEMSRCRGAFPTRNRKPKHLRNRSGSETGRDGPRRRESRPPRPFSPAPLVGHARLLDDELALLVLLARLVRALVLPAHQGVAGQAVRVAHGVQTGEQPPVLRVAERDVGDVREEVRATAAAAELLGDDVVVVRRVRATRRAAIHPAR